MQFLADASETFFAVAYVTYSGVRLLRDYLKNIKLRVLTCTDYFITEPDALKELLDYGASVKVLLAQENFSSED